MAQSLAVKYRPTSFDDVCGQSEIKTILQNQLLSGEIKHAYLFCGGAGTGKTTCARIFANEINKGQGGPIELDAASNNSVDDVREISQQAKTKSLESEYKIFILDECHMLSSSAWNAMLKLLEEPPEKAIFILCTTDPQKIPKTILSRVQRFQFQRISKDIIVERLQYICVKELLFPENGSTSCNPEALEYIAKLSAGGMRDAITMLDKCLAYSTDVTLENVVKALGVADYDVMMKLINSLYKRESQTVLDDINDVYSQGKDLKLFVKTFTDFVLDLCKYDTTRSYDYIQIPNTYDLSGMSQDMFYYCRDLLGILIRLNDQIKWDSTPKASIEATMLLECFREN